MPDFLVEFLKRYGLDATALLANAGWTMAAIQIVKQYVPVLAGYWTWLAVLIVSALISFMAYDQLGVGAVTVATLATAIAAIFGKNVLNQFVPGKSIQDKRNGGVS